MNLSHIVDALNKANSIVLSGHAKDRMKIVIDLTEDLYYGKLDMYVSKYEETDRFYTFATIRLLEREGKALYFLPMFDTKEDIVKKLLENA